MGHKAFRSQLTANELGGLKFASVGPKGPRYNPDHPKPTPSDNQGLWGSGVGIFPQTTKIPHLSGMPDAHGSGLQQMPRPGASRQKASHHRPPEEGNKLHKLI